MNNVLPCTLETIFSSYNIIIRSSAIFLAKCPDLRKSHGYSIDWVPRLNLMISGRLEGYILDIHIARNMRSRPWKFFYVTKARDPQGLSDPWKNIFTYFHSKVTVWTQNPFQLIVKEQKLSVFLFFSLFEAICVCKHIIYLCQYFMYACICFPERNELSLSCLEMEKFYNIIPLPFLMKWLDTLTTFHPTWLSLHFPLDKVNGKRESTYSSFAVRESKRHLCLTQNTSSVPSG